MMRYWFYVYQDGLCVAKGHCMSQQLAQSEAIHYAAIYGQDGPVKVKYRKVFSRKG